MLLISALVPAISYSLDTIERLNMILPRNVFIDDMNMGDRALTDVIEHLETREENILDRKINIVASYEERTKSKEFTLKELGYKSNLDEIKDAITNVIDNDLKLIEKYRNYKNIEENGLKFNIDYSIDHEKFMEALNEFDNKDLKQPINAELKFENEEFTIIGGDLGLIFDKERLYKELSEDTTDLETKEASLVLKAIEPEITIQDIEKQGIKEKVATFTTQFNSANKPRSENIRLAAESIKGTILAPNDIFSFNEVVGMRTAERGYKEAGVYIRGKVDSGLGGGICQVSTTLYNTVLFHDLEILERSNHSLTVPYVPLSRDAAVDWGNKDLKFRNNTDYYIYIDTNIRKNRITFDFYSTKSNKEVKLISETISKEDPTIEYKDDKTLEAGVEIVEDNGHIGYRSSLTKKVFVDGILVEAKQMSKDRYLTTPKIIKVNMTPPKVVTEEKVIEEIETEEVN